MGFEQPFRYTPSEQPRPEKKEKPLSHFEMQKVLMNKVSSETNASVQELYRMNQLVLPNGRVALKNFADVYGGIYAKHEVIEDKQKIYDADRSHSGSFMPATQERYAKQYGLHTEKEIIDHYKKKKEEHTSNQAEMIITALLHKALKERFLVVRASEFDDYLNGMDNLILDKQTGAVICAFDEVIENSNDEGKTSPKIAKMQAKAEQGGAHAKYGFALEKGRLVRSKVSHIPVFYLNLKSSDLQNLTESLFASFDGEMTDIENEIFTHLVASIEEQKSMLEDLHLPAVMRRKLGEFDIDGLKSFCKV